MPRSRSPAPPSTTTASSPLAAKGSKADVAALAPAEKRELLIMRARIPAAKLKTMDGRAFLLHAIAERSWSNAPQRLQAALSLSMSSYTLACSKLTTRKPKAA